MYRNFFIEDFMFLGKVNAFAFTNSSYKKYKGGCESDLPVTSVTPLIAWVDSADLAD